MGADDTMMLALEVAPAKSGGWGWCWYDYNSGQALVDGAEDSEAAAWRSATECYVERSDVAVRALVARAVAAEQRAEAAEVALAQAHALLRRAIGDRRKT